MIISRSPLRITLGGGGTDLPSYYKKKEGFLISAAINKYVYVTIIRPFDKGIYLKYSKIEKERLDICSGDTALKAPLNCSSSIAFIYNSHKSSI